MTTNVAPEVKAAADDLAKDMLAILHKHGVAQILPPFKLKELMVDLSIYQVKRDHMIMEHGIQVGLEQRNEPKRTN